VLSVGSFEHPDTESAANITNTSDMGGVARRLCLRPWLGWSESAQQQRVMERITELPMLTACGIGRDVRPSSGS
jgi:hypothetical protein